MVANVSEKWETIWEISIITFNLIFNGQSTDGYFKPRTNTAFLIRPTIHTEGC